MYFIYICVCVYVQIITKHFISLSPSPINILNSHDRKAVMDISLELIQCDSR